MDTATEYPIDGPLIAEVYRLGPGGETAELPRHRHDLTREQVETTQKARIILATAQVVVDRSYAKASTREIISAAGVSTKTFYAHFAGKEEAFLAGFTLMDGVMLGLAERPISTTQPRTDLRNHVRASLEQLAAWPLFTRMRFIEGPAAGPIALERRAAMMRSTVEVFARAIGEARARDDRVGSPSLGAITVLNTGLRDLMAQWVVDHGPETLPELAPVMVEAIERFCFQDPPDYVDGE
ncbi:MAG: TetR/AcrR family transcriptional regulator [Solirubrobacteraceae bacterium]|nr:TetR/AcrR family transcriptional regulator [Patulibacter sp.]